jgi:hypothetical protein
VWKGVPIPEEMLEDPDFVDAMTKFFGNADMAKMILMSNANPPGSKGEIKKIEIEKLTPEEIEARRKKRLEMNVAQQREKDLKFLMNYRRFYECPDATYETVKAAYKGHKLIKKEEKAQPKEFKHIPVPADMKSNP